jgi:hypothetical protein
VWIPPAATATAVVMPFTGTGAGRFVLVPSPSWP